MLTWEGGGWAHKYDVYFGTYPNNPPLVKSDLVTGTLGPDGPETYQVSGLQSGVTYYWRIVSKTMANQTASGPVWRFTASGSAPTPTPTPIPTPTPTPTATPTPTSTPTPTPTPTPPPPPPPPPPPTPIPAPPPPPPSPAEVVLYAGQATTRAGTWTIVSDVSAAAGVRISQPDAGVPKITTAAPNPATSFEIIVTP